MLAVADAPALPAALIADELAWAKEFAAEEKAPATREAYRSDVAQFTAWCTA